MPAFIPSKNHDRLNGEEFSPEEVTGSCMVSPHHRSVSVRPGVRVMADSGAFHKHDMLLRLTPKAALDRQLAFEKSRRRDGAARFPDGFEYVVTYDMLVGVDEAIVDGERVKRRGTEETAARAVKETLESAVHYYWRRHQVRGGIAYAAQGATLRQYMQCVRLLLPIMRPGRDILALGGFCIIGMQSSLKPLFVEVCRAVAPMLAARGIHRVHVLGVCVCDALIAAIEAFSAHGIELTTDSSSIERNSIWGKIWSAENMRRGRARMSPWRKMYSVEDKAARAYSPARLSIENIRRYADWMSAQGRATERARQPVRPIRPLQEALAW